MCICKGIFILFYFCRILNFVYETFPQAASLVWVCVWVCVYSSVVVVSVCVRECLRLSVIRLRWTPVQSPPFSSPLPSWLVLFWLIRRSGNRKGYRALILILLPFFFICLVKMGEVNMKFLTEVLFLSPVSLRHPGGKWRDGNCTLERTGDGVLLFQPERGSSWTDRALAVPPRDCVYVNVSASVPYGTLLLPYFVRGRVAVACCFCLGHLSLHWRWFLKEKLPDSAGFLACKSLFC